MYTVLLTISQSTYNYSTMDYTQGLNLPLRTGDCGVNNSPWWSIAHPSTVLPHDPGIDPLLDHHHSKLGPNGKREDAVYHTTVTMHPQLYTVAAKKNVTFSFHSTPSRWRHTVYASRSMHARAIGNNGRGLLKCETGKPAHSLADYNR